MISDGNKDYYNSLSNNTNNNLAFNIEDANINSNFYKFLPSIPSNAYKVFYENNIPGKTDGEKYDYNRNGTTNDIIKTIGNPYNSADPFSYDAEVNRYLYSIELQGSKVLTSEMDLDGIVVDNISEIVKATNTAGRKVYVQSSNTVTGFLGNTTKDPIESINKGTGKSIVDISKLETDTDFTEYVTFSPPTGLNESQALAKTVADKTGMIILVIVPTMVIVVGSGYLVYRFIKRKKFYK